MAGGGGGGKGAKGGAALNINLTPMIDCTMLLVIFFLLTTEIASSNFVALDLPKPTIPIGRTFPSENRVIINVMPYSDEVIQKDPRKAHRAATFEMEPRRYTKDTLLGVKGDGRSLKAQLQSSAAGRGIDTKDLTVVIRSDAKIDYSEVEMIWACIQDAGCEKVQLATWIDKKGGE
ncbi:MAG: biopolymer transporter ExbD [Planctomycetota bacterium]|nr:biopolymer transporter ExbD [Planctomycetota bacterium]